VFEDNRTSLLTSGFLDDTIEDGSYFAKVVVFRKAAQYFCSPVGIFSFFDHDIVIQRFIIGINGNIGRGIEPGLIYLADGDGPLPGIAGVPGWKNCNSFGVFLNHTAAFPDSGKDT
jgi:hypothetical protein